MDLEEIKAETNTELMRFEAYLGLMEDKFEDAALKDQQRMSEQVDAQYELGLGEQTDADVEFYELSYKYHSDYEGAFPRYLRYSFIILLYLIFESSLRRTCRLVLDRVGVTRKVPSRDFVKECRRLLEENAHISSIDDTDWGRLREFAQVRNCIVHFAGDLSLHQSASLQAAIANKAIPLGGVDYLYFETEYCEDMLRVVRDFYADLFAELDKSWD